MKSLLRRSVRKIIHPLGYDVIPASLVKPPSGCEAIRLVLAWIFNTEKLEDMVLVQIGACDGIGADPVHKFVRQGRMKAYLVEPLPDTFASLAKNYEGIDGVSCINCAVGMEDGEAAMYTVKGEGGYGASSFSKDHVTKHLGANTEHEIEQLTIKVCSYRTLLKEHAIEYVDIVQIDVEGMDDLLVISILDSGVELPKFINFESVHFSRGRSDKLFQRLAENFVWIHDKFNTLAIRKDVYEGMVP